jgi:hypothetical protein
LTEERKDDIEQGEGRGRRGVGVNGKGCNPQCKQGRIIIIMIAGEKDWQNRRERKRRKTRIGLDVWAHPVVVVVVVVLLLLLFKG